jgi:hypothetical protein
VALCEVSCDSFQLKSRQGKSGDCEKNPLCGHALVSENPTADAKVPPNFRIVQRRKSKSFENRANAEKQRQSKRSDCLGPQRIPFISSKNGVPHERKFSIARNRNLFVRRSGYFLRRVAGVTAEPFTDTVPSALCAALWQTSVQVFVAAL